MSPNKTLKGHKLLILTPLQPPAGTIDAIQAKFPDLEIVNKEVKWSAKGPPHSDVTLTSEDWKDVTVLLTFANFPQLGEAPKLEYVQLMSAGANHVFDAPLFKDTDVAFCTANGVHGPQISEWIIMTYLAFEHRLPFHLDSQKSATWTRGPILLVEDAVSKTVGILGYGAIGRQTARVATAMGMKVHAYTLHPRSTPASRRDNAWSPPGLGDPEGVFPTKWFSGGSKEDLHAFLSSGLDLLVVATPLTSDTTHLLGKEEFEVLEKAGKGRTFVSNVARGPVINTEDIIEALETGQIRGAALDVTDPEPLPDGHPLWGAKNVIVTPHVSGASTAYAERVFGVLRYNLERFAEGFELVNRVDRGRGY